ncbi:MAG: hypothetical protein E7047_10720 [Lentisphaerae bacterium]|nr:hypothetical protein [Lentisphaerota bacterium]
MDWSFRQNWDEFTWSREIRKDEMRISGYFRALPTCLDLPGEDEMIFKRLMSQPELVPTGVKDPMRMLKSEFEQFENEAEWDEERRDVRKRNTFEAVRKVENLAKEWVVATAGADRRSMPTALKVTCLFGKLLSRIYNFEETDPEDDTSALRIGLLKYMLRDISELKEALNNCSGCTGGHFREESLSEALAFVREIILDKLKTLREKA